MHRVFTRCQRTGLSVATQLVMDRSTFEAVRLPVFTFACAACGSVHAWRKEEAWCEEAAWRPPAPPDGLTNPDGAQS